MQALDAALYAQLATAATTLYSLVVARVYDALAPQGAAMPYVVFNVQAGGYLNLTPTDYGEWVYQVKGVAASQSVANSIDSAIATRLHNMALSVSGWTLVSCMRENEAPSYIEIVNGAPIFNRGSFYRIRASK